MRVFTVPAQCRHCAGGGPSGTGGSARTPAHRWHAQSHVECGALAAHWHLCSRALPGSGPSTVPSARSTESPSRRMATAMCPASTRVTPAGRTTRWSTSVAVAAAARSWVRVAGSAGGSAHRHRCKASWAACCRKALPWTRPRSSRLTAPPTEQLLFRPQCTNAAPGAADAFYPALWTESRSHPWMGHTQPERAPCSGHRRWASS